MDDWGLNWLGHSLSLGAIIGAMAGIFTPIAALVAASWYGVQLYESKTVQGLIRRRREHKIRMLRLRLAELEHVARDHEHSHKS